MDKYERMKKRQIDRAEDLLQKVKAGDPTANVVIAYVYAGKHSDEYDYYYALIERKES